MAKTAEELMKLIRPRTDSARTSDPNDLMKLIRPRTPVVDDEDVEHEEEGFFNVLGNFGKHLFGLSQLPVGSLEEGDAELRAGFEETKGKILSPMANQLADNAMVSGWRAYNYVTGTPFRAIGSDIARGFNSKVGALTSMLGDAASVEGGVNLVGQMATGLARQFLTTPLEAASGTKLDAEGNVIPLTPEEQILRSQDAIGTVASIFTAAKLHKALNPIPTGAAAANVRAGFSPGSLAKYIANDAAIGAASGAVYGGIKGAGTEDHLNEIIDNSLTFLPIGTLFGAVGYRGHRGQILKAKGEYINSLQNAPLELAAARNIRITADRPMSEIVATIDALATANDVVDAAVRSRLDVGDGIIVDGLDEVKVKELQTRLGPAESRIKPVWEPEEKIKHILDSRRPNIGGMVPMVPQFLDYFDKAAYLAAGSSKTGRQMLVELQALGLSEEDIIAHGKRVKQVIKDRAASGGVRPPTQPEIDQATDLIRKRGEERLLKMGEGQKFKDATGRVWVKQGGLISDGEQTIKIESDLAKLTIGRLKKEANPDAGRLEIESVPFDNKFGRKEYEMNVYRGANGSTLIMPHKLIPEVEDFFTKNGFLPQEVVQIVGRNGEGIVLGNKGRTLRNDPDAPKPGYVRFYHGGVGTDGKRWLSPNRSYAEGYARKSGGEVSYVDLPKNHPALTKAFDDTGSSTKAPYNNFEADATIASRLKKLDNAKSKSALPDDMEIPVDPSKAGFIQVQEVGTGKVLSLHPSQLRRFPNGVNSELYKFGDMRVGKAGILNQTSFLDHLYEEFKKTFFFDEVPRESFENVFLKFTEKIGMRSKEDVFRLQTVFYKRLREDAIKLASTAEDAAHLKDIQISLEKFAGQLLDDKGHMLRSALEENGMYMRPIGGGAYEIRFIEDNALFLKVSNADQALEAINKGKQKTDGTDLDGGNTGGTPPASSNITGASLPSAAGGIPLTAKWLDAVNVGKLSFVTPIRDFIASADAIGGGVSQLLGRVAEPLQKANMMYKAFAHTEPAKKLSEQYNTIAKLVKTYKLNESQLMSVSDAIEAMSLDEIENRLLYRPLTTAEKAYAKKLSNIDVENVIEYMYQVKSRSEGAQFGSIESAYARNELMKEGLFTPEIIKAGDDLMLNQIGDVDKFSIYGVLRAAQAYSHPELALDRATFMARNRFTPGMVAMVKELDKFYKGGAHLFEIDEKARINGYLPHIRLSEATGYNPFALPNSQTARFIHELNRVGISSNGKLLRNPVEISYRYLQAGLRVKSGFADELASIKKAFTEEIKKLKAINPELAASVADRIDKHMAQVRGIPEIDEQLSRAVNKTMKETLKWTPSSKSLVAITEMAAQGARSVFLWRDISSIMGNTFAAFGPTFAKDVFTTPISFKQIKQLVANKEIPEVEGLDLIYPGDGPADIIDGNVLRNRKMMKAADTALSLTGQKHVYKLAYAKMYITTRSWVDKLAMQFEAKQVTKEQVFKKLNLSIHNPGVVKHFDDLWEAGNYEQAARFLGNWNAKFVANAFGNNNNPVQWAGRPGRLLGQFGSWGINQVQTYGNMFMRGTAAERIARGTRLSLFNGALYSAGYALGLDMKSWYMWPLGLYGIGPVPMTLVAGGQALNNMLSSNESPSQLAKNTLDRMIPFISHNRREGLHFDSDNLANIFVPYSYAVQDVIEGFKAWENDYGAIAALRATGFKLDEDTVSPIQEMQGVKPKPERGYSQYGTFNPFDYR